jgi:hypothetical protein
MLEVTLDRAEAARALPVLRVDLPDAERLRLLDHRGPAPAAGRDRALADLVADARRRWRSPWLRECAAYEASAEGARPSPTV